MTAIHVSIPVRLLEDFDETLGFTQSRSAKIASLITRELNGDMHQGISDASSRQLMAALSSREDVDATMKVLLVQLLTSSSSNAEHDA
jgi:metal-responsive CopG/Arc/MetJ family transcriptional regulator